MPHEVIMPALGMAQDTGQLVAWLKKAGDAVKAGDPIMEVETDKATMEVEAQADGYLTDIQAAEGTDVPVGNVVAMISDTPEGTGKTAPAAADADKTPTAPAPAPAALPDGKKVIMPALGMAQDSGVIVAWAKAAGDAVAADDVLFEVETDKATMEVPAGQDGFLAAVLATEGDDVPVGDVIAIIAADKPDTPIVRSRAEAGPVPAAASDSGADTPDTPPPAATAPREAPAPVPRRSGGRILASPKAKRIAHAEGLDLARLAEAGVAEPYHVSDLETLRAMPAAHPATTPQTVAGAAPQRITARVSAEPHAAFLDWLASETGGGADAAGVLASFAAGALRSDVAPITVAVETAHDGRARRLKDPDLHPIAALEDAEAEARADLVIRDLTGTAITSVQLGAEPAPTLSLARDGDALVATYEGALPPDQALALVHGFAARLAEPMRHLL